MQKGIVTKSTGLWYTVELNDGESIQCRMPGKFRLNGQKLTNPIAVGDNVEIKMEEEGKGIIQKFLARKNYIVRASPRKKHHLHLLASNVDLAIVIVTIVNPNLKQGFIDRFLLMTEPHDIPTCIVFNKSDLYSEEDREMYEALAFIYEHIGYKVLLTSALTGEGIDELKSLLQNKISLIGGQSGVGKSSLVNKIEAQLGLRTEEISDYSGKGQHTTTFAQMFSLSFGGKIIDTPGIKTLGFIDLEPMDVAHNFRELFEVSKNCKFSDCSHRNEPHCAVKTAVEEGGISELRYLNYIQIVEEIEDLNYWERHKNM